MKGDQVHKRSFSHEQIARKDNPYHLVVDKEHFTKGPRSQPSLSDDEFYNTPEMICQGRIVQTCALDMGDRNSMNTCQHSTNPFESDYSLERIIPRHLEPEIFNEDKTFDSELIVPDPNELLVLREKCVEQEANIRRCRKAKEEKITRHVKEKHELLRQIAFLKKQKETAEKLAIVGQVEQLRL